MDLGEIPLLVFGGWSMVWSYAAIRTVWRMWRVGPETPEWSKNDRNLELLGLTAFPGGMLIGSLTNHPLGLVISLSGPILIIVPEAWKRHRPSAGQTVSAAVQSGGAER